MSKRRYFAEWPLAVFTLALQLGAGLSLTVAAESTPTHALRPLAMAVFPIVAVGLLFSLLHLGRPFDSWKAVRNLGSSRLSLEVLLTLAFAVSALVLSIVWWKEIAGLRLLTGVLSSALGLAAVVSSALIYSTAARRAWSSAHVLPSFLGTTLLLSSGIPLALGINAQVYTALALCGSILLLLSAVPLWKQITGFAERPTWVAPWLFSCMLLTASVPLALTFAERPQSAIIAISALLLSIISTRLLTYVAAELEPRF